MVTMAGEANALVYLTPRQLMTIGDNSYKPHYTDF